MIGYIYKIHNTITEQNYIGQTVDINRRRRTHFNHLRNNCHDNPKLQCSWNKYGEDAFTFEYWEFPNINQGQLDALEIEYIDKYNGLTEGYNLTPGGINPPIHQKIKDDDVATFLCIQFKFGDGYGKTCEEIFGWAKGTASNAKRRIRYAGGWNIYESLSDEEKELRANDFVESQHLYEIALKRQMEQGGCAKAYQLTQDDFNFAFMAQEMGHTYQEVAEWIGVKKLTVKDWFAKRSRNKERAIYEQLNNENRNLLIGRVKTAELSGKPKSESSI